MKGNWFWRGNKHANISMYRVHKIPYRFRFRFESILTEPKARRMFVIMQRIYLHMHKRVI